VRKPRASGDSGRPCSPSRPGPATRSPSGSAPRAQSPVASRGLGHAPGPRRTGRQPGSIGRMTRGRKSIKGMRTISIPPAKML
jgi:hypothetical protein